MGNETGPAHMRILNPLLDAIFNPGEKSPLRNTLSELASAHSDFSILVPPTSVLLNCTDFSSQSLRELCYTNDEFVKSHIIRTTSASPAPVTPVAKQHSLIYSTMNGRQILLKNKAVFSGKGFKKSVRVRVTGVGHFVAFSSLFRKGACVSLIYIEASLYGPQPAVEQPQKDAMALHRLAGTSSKHQQIGFEELLRKFPLLSKTMSPSFYSLFHHNNREFQALRTHGKLSLAETKQLFELLVHRATQVVQNAVNIDSADGDHTYNLLQSLSMQNPGMDMNRLVHEYVELHMYDRVWSSIVSQYSNAAPGERIDDWESPKIVLTHDLYRDLSCLSLNQLDIPVTDPWDLNVLHRRVADAIKVFSALAGPNVTNQRQKIAVIKDTVSTLTTDTKHTFSGPVIDADTLIGLLIMVVVHSKVPNLECHLFYIRHFGLSHQIDDPSSAGSEDDLGFMSYILSNIDAVIFHLHDSGTVSENGHLADMSSASAKNYKFWYAIQKQDIKTLETFLDAVGGEYEAMELPRQHVLRSRNIHGESSFHLAIRTRNPHIFSMLLRKTEPWIFLEDFIFDKNTSTNQTLLMTALQEEVPEITCELLDLLLGSMTYEEQCLYFNAKDTSGRTAGHYLSHDLAALDRIGHLIDWEAKDANSHTPLFSMCRCYDHAEYEKLVQKAFMFVMAKHPSAFITYDTHTDKAGNTLLHALARAVPETKMLSEPRVLVNVNEINHKGVTPAALSVRYNRVENLKCIFRDPRLIFDHEEPNYCYNLMDYYSFSASKSLSGPNEEFSRIEACVAKKYFDEYYPLQNSIEIGFVNARYDVSISDWNVNIFHRRSKAGMAVASKYIPLDKLRLFYMIYRQSSTMSFFPSEDVFWMNYLRGKPTLPICAKYKSNRMLEHLSMFFALANFLRQDAKKVFLKTFARCCKDSSASGLEMMKEAAIARENARNAAGDIKLSHANVSEILYFIEFSVADLLKYRSLLSQLNQYTALGAVRQNDARGVTDHFFRNISGLGLKNDDDICEARRIDSPYLELQRYVAWIEMCADELLSRCRQVTEKARKWEDTYTRIKSINADIHKFEGLVIPLKPETPSAEAGNDGSTPTNGERSISRRSTLSLEEIPAEESHEEVSFFSFGIIDSKKSRYKKLVLAKSEQVKLLMDLNVDLKLEHEALAAEISQFLEYRTGALKFGIKQFTRKSLVSLRNRHYELSKLLCGARKRPNNAG
ncbi:hypothetical protein OXX79_002527 [Metschnikowia pulcherrima]